VGAVGIAACESHPGSGWQHVFSENGVLPSAAVPLVPRLTHAEPFYLVLLGVVLLTLALVVRSGMLASKHPDEPINSAMRAAMAETSPQLSTEDANEIRKDFPTAYTTRRASCTSTAPRDRARRPQGSATPVAQLRRAAS
jgi:hypothetical protein